MFKIIDFQHINGKLKTTIEADDQFFGMFIRFIRMAQKFCILLDYKLKKEKEIMDFSKTGPLRKKRAARARARMLKEFRNVPGTRSQRLNILQEMCIGDGIEVTQDRLDAQLQLASQEEKKKHHLRIKLLIHKGKSISEISSSLGLAKTTVARYAQEVRGAQQATTARVKRTVQSLAERPPSPSFSTEPPSTLPPSPEVA
jgi:hypothetical protein